MSSNGFCVGDYRIEAENQMKYRELVLNDPILRKHVNVPEVFDLPNPNPIIRSFF